MAENKTKETSDSVRKFIESVEPEIKQKDAFTLLTLMEKITGYKAKMWGTGIIGFGSYHYRYESGHEGDAPLTGFSPRKANISLYAMGEIKDKDALLQQLGKHKMGKGCLYINKLADIDLKILEKLIRYSVDSIKKKYPS